MQISSSTVIVLNNLEFNQFPNGFTYNISARIELNNIYFTDVTQNNFEKIIFTGLSVMIENLYFKNLSISTPYG